MPKKGQRGNGRNATAKQQARPSAKQAARPKQTPKSDSAYSKLAGQNMYLSPNLQRLAGNASLAAQFWDARKFPNPPPVSTSFGHYAPVRSMDRLSFQTHATQTTAYLISWSRSGVSGICGQWTPGGGSGVNIGLTTVPVPWTAQLKACGATSIRPFKMSVQITNTTGYQRLEGEMYAVPLDQPIGGLTGTAPNPTSGVFYLNSTLPALSGCAMWDNIALMADTNQSRTFSANSLCSGETFVCPPSSYVAYNAYEDFFDIGGSTTYLPATQGAVLFQSDGVSDRDTVLALEYPDRAWLKNIPPLRRWLFVFPPTPNNVQTYTMQIHRVDGLRFPANHIGNALAIDSPMVSEAQDKQTRHMALVASANPFPQQTN